MSRDEIVDRLTRVFRTVFQDQSLCLYDEMKGSDVASWDSMNNIRLVLSIEEEFGFKFTLRDINDLPDVGALVRAIESKLA